MKSISLEAKSNESAANRTVECWTTLSTVRTGSGQRARKLALFKESIFSTQHWDFSECQRAESTTTGWNFLMAASEVSWQLLGDRLNRFPGNRKTEETFLVVLKQFWADFPLRHVQIRTHSRSPRVTHQRVAIEEAP
jgi:hypothetical protein